MENVLNVLKGHFVLVAHSAFPQGEKSCFRLHGPQRAVKALNNYVFEVEDLRSGGLDDIHISCFKVYSDVDIDNEAILAN